MVLEKWLAVLLTLIAEVIQLPQAETVFSPALSSLGLLDTAGPDCLVKQRIGGLAGRLHDFRGVRNQRGVLLDQDFFPILVTAG